MADKVRVAALAKELGVPTKVLLAKLNEMGEYVKSAASVIEAPVARGLRAMYPDAPLEPPSIRRGPVLARVAEEQPTRPSLPSRIRDPFDPLYIASTPSPRGPYNGARPTGLKRMLLDRYIVPKAKSSRRPRGGFTYWASEVAEAERLTETWAPVILDGISGDEVVRWINVLSAASAELAAALFAEGVEPEDLEFDIRYDLGRPSMQTRVVIGNMTVKEVATEVHRRRAM